MVDQETTTVEETEVESARRTDTADMPMVVARSAISPTLRPNAVVMVTEIATVDATETGVTTAGPGTSQEIAPETVRTLTGTELGTRRELARGTMGRTEVERIGILKIETVISALETLLHIAAPAILVIEITEMIGMTRSAIVIAVAREIGSLGDINPPVAFEMYFLNVKFEL